MEYYCEFESPLGRLTLVCDGESLTGLYLPGQGFSVGNRLFREDLPVFQKTKAWLVCYFSGNPEPVDFPVKSCGTAFQQRLWEILKSIPWGEIRTYGSIAREISETMSAQAVGGAVGRNPISIVIPCHRCVGAGGRLTGYAGGLTAKQYLLQLEANSHDCK